MCKRFVQNMKKCLFNAAIKLLVIINIEELLCPQNSNNINNNECLFKMFWMYQWEITLKLEVLGFWDIASASAANTDNGSQPSNSTFSGSRIILSGSEIAFCPFSELTEVDLEVSPRLSTGFTSVTWNTNKNHVDIKNNKRYSYQDVNSF